MHDQTRLTDDQFRDWMRGNLARAAEHFGLVVHGSPAWGWNLRSIGSAATGRRGEVWLRVGTEREADLAEADLADIWTGIPDSTTVVGVPKPTVLDSVEWATPALARRVRADVTTLEPGEPCSPTEALRAGIKLPARWWNDLKHAVTTIETTTTTRYASAPPGGSRVRMVFGDALADSIGPIQRATAHGDLHWNNVFQPDLRIMDWELWGLYPAGHDAATLYLFALLVPETAERVHDLFADQLDSKNGAVSQLAVATRILLAARNGDDVDLASAIRKHIESAGLVERATTTSCHRRQGRLRD